MKSTLPSTNVRHGRRPPRRWHRLGAAGLAIVLAGSVHGCATVPAEPEDAAESAATSAAGSSTAPAERRSSGTDAPAPAQAEGKKAAKSGEEDNEDSHGETPRITAPAEPGRPALVEDTGTGEEKRRTTERVGLDESVRPAAALEVSLDSAAALTAEGHGPGGMSGPAIAVVVSVRNTTDEAVSTLGSSVTVAYGPERLPADVSPQPDDVPLPTEVRAGKTVSGTYTFLVPEDRREDVVVTVSYRPTDPAAVFAGSTLAVDGQR